MPADTKQKVLAEYERQKDGKFEDDALDCMSRDYRNSVDKKIMVTAPSRM